MHRLNIVAQSRLFDPSHPLEDTFARAHVAGFSFVELAAGDATGISPAASAEPCEELVRLASAASVSIAALRAPAAWGLDILRSSVAANRQAADALAASLQRARWLRAGLLVLPLGDGADAPGSPATAREEVSHQEAANRLLDALLQLRFAAQRWAVTMACVLPSEALPMSPPEARDLMDRANSPWVRVCLDLAAASRRARAEDWIDALGHRLTAFDFDIEASAPTGDAGEFVPRVRRALQRIRFDGAAMTGGSLDLSEAHRRTAALLPCPPD